MPITRGEMSEARTIAGGLSQLSEEEQHVLAWRYAQVRLLGFEREQALELAAGSAELSLLRRLVADGCPLELAFRIAS